MKKPDWNSYFNSRYKPVGNEWGYADLQKYRKWYTTWIPYMLSVIPSSVTPSFKKGIEIGAGIGAVSSLLIDRGIDMTVTDVSEHMVSAGKKIFSPDSCFYFDIQKPLTIKKTFDIVIAIEVLEHLDKPDKALKNIAALLKKDGWFIGTTPYPFAKNMTDPTHVNVQKPDYWVEQCKKHGFRTVETKPLTCLPLLWKIHSSLQLIFPLYTSFPYCISTTVIAAQR